MFRRRLVVVRRPRLLGAALLGGAGFLIGRRRGSQAAASPGVAPATQGTAASLAPLAPADAALAPATPALAPAAASLAPATPASSPPTTPASSPPSLMPDGGTPDPVDRLSELARLHGDGSLTDEEFTQAKREVLGS
ncbi:MAG TPA: SHOCT domain-containing protein [Candidatus Baltobacteraceae bacterium]|nr:SHOCT domain-containing protein [Candidatus Baltobacteraceae bacterium]